MSIPFDYSDYSYFEISRKIKRFKPNNIEYEFYNSDLINLNWNSPETYIDSIIDNYKNLGIKPSVSIISAHKDTSNTIYIYAMYGSLSDKCYINNVIKHGKQCKCSYINYEKFSVSSDLQISYYSSQGIRINNDNISDLSKLILDVVKHFHNFV